MFVAHCCGGDVVDGEAERSPERQHDGEDAEPDGQQRHEDERGRRDRCYDVGPHTRAEQNLQANVLSDLGL